MIVTPDQFDFEKFYNLSVQKRKVGNQGGKKKTKYLDIVTAFDIETTRILSIEQSVMYIWQWQIGMDTTVIGRTWQEFIEFSKTLIANMAEDVYLVVYVHNLSYEFQFLSGIYNFQPDEVFAVKARKVLKCSMYNHLEFRCSYLQTNMSLDLFCKKMKVEHGKLTGSFDYSKQRYSFTPITPEELDYCVNDVLGLVEAITAELKHDKDNLYTIPMTSTGYVRRDMKRTKKLISHFLISNQLPDYHTYTLCEEAFRGGNTHASRFYVGMILEDVESDDRSSSYPDVLCNQKFPMSRFKQADTLTPDYLIDLITRRRKAVLCRVAFHNIEVHGDCPVPYLPVDKCRRVKKRILDNGRIMSAEYLETTITDIDLLIILNQYEYDDMQVLDISYANYGFIPKPLVELICYYYKGKTELKGIEEEIQFYEKFKNRINAIYGAMAQKSVKPDILYLMGEWAEDDAVLREELLAEANPLFPYQWGVWTTAHARNELQKGIDLCGDKFVYCDTDSTKHIGKVDFTEYNKEKIAASLKSGAYAKDKKGITHYMGVYESERPYKQFATRGAKKYCVTYETGGGVHLTLSGVNKKSGAYQLDQHGGIEAFLSKSFIFKVLNHPDYKDKLESLYNDKPPMSEYKLDEIHTIPITRNVVLRPVAYTLSDTQEYINLLQNCQEYY